MTSTATRDARSTDYQEHTKADLVRLLVHILDDGDEAAIKKLSKDELVDNLAMKMDCPDGDFKHWIADDKENKDAVMAEEKKVAAEAAVESYLADQDGDEGEDDGDEEEQAPAKQKASKKHKAEADLETPARKKPKVDASVKKKAPASLFASETKTPVDDEAESSGDSEPLVPLGTALPLSHLGVHVLL